MSERNTYDLTSGSILNKLFLIALPIMGTQLLQMTYNLADMFWLGRVSSNAVAASGTAGMYIWMSNAFLMIGRMGAEIGVSQSLGRGKKEDAYRYSANALFLSVVLGVGYALVMILFRHPLVGFFNIQEQVVYRDTIDYLVVVSLGIPALFVGGAMNGIFNGSGNSRLPFYINGIGLVFNMILDPLLILKFGMGIKGAAYATIAAQWIVAVVFLAAVKWSRGRPFEVYLFRDIWKVSSRKVKQIFRWSVPIGMESLFFTLLSMVISRMVAAYGADAIAIQKVGAQVESLSWLIGGGFASALTAYVGQNYGAGKWNRIQKGFRISAGMMVAWGVLITMILFFGAEIIYQLFLPDPEIAAAGASYLKILAAAQLMACMEALAAGAFRGIGKTLPPSVVSISMNLIRIPIAWYLSRTSLGLDGIWWGLSIGTFLRGLFLLIWYLPVARKQPH